MQSRIDRALGEIELSATAATQLLSHPIAVQRTIAQNRQQHPVNMPLNLAKTHTSTVYV